MRFILIFLLSPFCVAQTFIEQEFIGFINTHDNAYIPYNLRFICNSFECVGYSISDLNGDNETKSEVYGQINFTDNVIHFKEINTIYTKADYQSFDHICLIQFDLKIKRNLQDFKDQLKSKYIGFFEDGSVCSKGTINLTSSNKFLQKIEKLKNQISNLRSKNIVEDSIEISAEKALKYLTKNPFLAKDDMLTKSVPYHPGLRLFVQDMGISDNDLIQLKTDDFIQKISLTKDYFEINIKPKSTIEIKALEEGSSPSIPIKLILKDIYANTSSKEIFVLRKDQKLSIYFE